MLGIFLLLWWRLFSAQNDVCGNNDITAPPSGHMHLLHHAKLIFFLLCVQSFGNKLVILTPEAKTVFIKLHSF